MNQAEFVRRRKPVWDEFGELLAAYERSRKRPDAAALRRIGSLYHQTSGDLALARTYFPGSSLILFLNQLAQRGHGFVYGRQVVSKNLVRKLFLDSFPAALFKARFHVAVSTLIFTGAAAFAFLAAWLDPTLRNLLVPEALARDLANAQPGQMSAGAGAAMSSYITTNNMQVAFIGFAFGISFGLGTIYILIQNGLLIGALAGAYAKYGLSLTFWSLIAPHGILELPAIFVATAAGLMIGDSVLRPGDRSRSGSLKSAAATAFTLLAGVIPVFVIAGLIEGFFTPAPLSPLFKLAAAAAVGSAVSTLVWARLRATANRAVLSPDTD